MVGPNNISNYGGFFGISKKTILLSNHILVKSKSGFTTTTDFPIGEK